MIFGLITSVAALLIIRPRVWLNDRIYDWGAVTWADVLISAVIWGIGSALVGGLYGAVFGGLGLGIIAGLSHALRTRPAFRMADALMAALIAWLVSGSVIWIVDATFFKTLKMGLAFWMGPSLFGWLGVGATAGLIAWLIARLRTAQPVETLQEGGRGVRQWLVLMAVLIAWLVSELITWIVDATFFKTFKMGLAIWMGPKLLSDAATAGLIAWLIARLRTAQPVEALQESGIRVRKWLVLRWRQWLIGGVGAASVVSVSVVVLMAWSQRGVIRGIYFVFCFFGMAVITVLTGSFIWVQLLAPMFAALAGVLGALFGALGGGLTGPEIERRTAPNQGIRQSAVNIGVFALVGGLTVGTFFCLLMLPVLMLVTGTIPDLSECLIFELDGFVFWGTLSGLVPGAACFQHFALRLILWCHGVMPWNYIHFLNYATERRLLQRVGGRYRFIHELLREHFAAMEPIRIDS